MNGYTVYKHTCPNGKVYIGITGQDVNVRWKSNGLGYKTQAYFYRAILKYGWKNIKHEVLCENLHKEEAEKMEMDLIKTYKSNDCNFGYNVREGGSLSLWREDSKEKLRQSNLGKHLSDITKKKLHDFNIGKTICDETRKKISNTTKGKPKTLEHAKHISEGKKGVPATKLKKRVVRVEDGKMYPSAKEACEELGLKQTTNISAACLGRRKTAGGYHWRYIDEEKNNTQIQ